MTPPIGGILGGFHHRVDHRLTGDILVEGRKVDGCIPSLIKNISHRRYYRRWIPKSFDTRT